MIITDERIKVTEQMMFDNGLSRMFIGQIGIPQDEFAISIEWKVFQDLTDSDFDKIENFFLNKLSK